MKNILNNVQTEGFTLLELIVTMTVLAIVVALGAPSFARIVDNRQITQQTDGLRDAFLLARSSALTNGQATSVCWNTGADANTIAQVGRVVVTNTVGPVTLKDILVQPDGIQFVATADADECITFNSQGRISTAVSFGVCKGNDIDLLKTVSVGINGRPEILGSNPAGFTCS